MINLSKVLITGAEGKIGQSLNFGIKKSRYELDVTKSDQIKKVCDLENPSAILCLSSINLQNCEKNPLEAYFTNVFGVYNMAKEAEKRKIPIAIISTGAIFNGKSSDKFNEEDVPNPINIYGQTKYLAEIIIQNIVKKHIIIRAGWLYGFKDNKKNSLDRILDSIKQNFPIQVTNDQYGSPTYIEDFISNVEKILLSEKYGIFHVANQGSASALEFANEAINFLKSSSNITETSIKNNISGPQRSESEVLISNKIKMRDWKDALFECLKANNQLNL